RAVRRRHRRGSRLRGLDRGRPVRRGAWVRRRRGEHARRRGRLPRRAVGLPAPGHGTPRGDAVRQWGGGALLPGDRRTLRHPRLRRVRHLGPSALTRLHTRHRPRTRITDATAPYGRRRRDPPHALARLPRAGGGVSHMIGLTRQEGAIMRGAELLVDAFGRIRETVHGVVDGLTPTQLTYRVDDDANSIAWLVWHLTRIQDDHVADAAGVPQVWTH